MKKKVILIGIIVLTFFSCGKKVVDTQTNTEIVKEAKISKPTFDYFGTYSGILPGADTEGIKTTLTIADETNYCFSMLYLNKRNQPIFQSGKYIWNDKGNIITLLENKQMPKQFLVEENQVTILDLKGGKITGDIAEKYILKKELNTNLKGDQVPTNNFELAGKKYELTEMGGIPLTKDGKILYIQFFTTGSFSAFAGCNNISGQYEFSDLNKLKFSKTITTRMACPNMQTEQEFLKYLGEIDSYSKDEDYLLLNKPNMPSVLRFELIK